MNGNEAMTSSTVISEVVYGNTFVARINGTNDENYYIYCNATDICKIHCQSANACTKLFLYCFGTCYVACDEDNGIECPFFGVYLDLTTPSPTTIPSHGPSGYPTHLPTATPTMSLGSEPTRLPTEIPTLVGLIPSINPNSQPSTTQNRDNETPLGVKRQVLLAVIVTRGTCLLICMISLFVYCHKRSKKIKEQREVEMKEILQKSVAALSLKRKTSDRGAIPGQQQNNKVQTDIGRTKGQSIDLQRTKGGGDINEYNNQDIIQDEGACVGTVGVATDVDTEIMFSDDEGDESGQTTGKDTNPNQDQ